MTKDVCTHLEQVNLSISARTQGCEECLKSGDIWVHLRKCLSCGHVGCCDSSQNKHARRHYMTSRHPIIQSFQPGEAWLWCYIDNTFVTPAVTV